MRVFKQLFGGKLIFNEFSIFFKYYVGLWKASKGHESELLKTIKALFINIWA